MAPFVENHRRGKPRARDVEGVVLPVEAVDDGRERGLLQVPEVRGGLARLLADDQELRVRAPEAVDHHLRAGFTDKLLSIQQ